MKKSAPEELFFIHLKTEKMPDPIREHIFLPSRKFRADFCWPDIKLIVEIDGQTWAKGGHSSGAGIERDYERDALAMLDGWRVLRFTTGQVKSGYAIITTAKMHRILSGK